jgi:YihY family inner membrane protein
VILDALRLAWRASERFFDHSGPDRAAAVAYYTLLSLLPLMIFSVSVGMFFFGSFDAAYNATVFMLRGVVAHLDPASMAALRGFAERSVRFQWFGLIVLAWTARRSFSALFGALSVVFQVPARNYATGNLVAITMVAVNGLGLLLTMALTTMRATLEGMLQRYGLDGVGAVRVMPRLLDLALTWILPVIITFVFFFIIYRMVPRGVVRTRHALIGATLATVLWEGAKAAFAYYVLHLAHYSGLYGALEGIIVLGLWLELSVTIVLYSGEVVALLVQKNT